MVRTVGEIGRWQLRLSVLLSLVGILNGWQILSVVFLAPHTEHWCAPPDGHHCSDTTAAATITTGVPRCTSEQWRAIGVPYETRVSQYQ